MLVGRSGCHLCEAARTVVARVCAETGTSWREVDCDADPSLARWSDWVPVVLVDGERQDVLRVDPDRLRRVLEDPPGRHRWWR